jgi:predicted metal-dependent hydrolase
VTESARARRISIRVSPRDGVRVTVPRRHDLREVERFVHSRRDWIARHVGRFAALRAAAPPAVRPDTIDLPAIGERWRVEYRETKAGRVTLRAAFGAAGPGLRLSGTVGDTVAVQAALRRWFRTRAGEKLLPWLRQVSLECGLSYTRAVVRSQRTRWGSCTALGVISLNAKLLLLPPAAVRYVLVHELAHTRHLDHSARFWQLVERHEPGYTALRAALRNAATCMPGWVDGGG